MSGNQDESPSQTTSVKSTALRHPLEAVASPPMSPELTLRRASSPSTPNRAKANRDSNSSPQSSNHRNSVIGNLNNWISDLNTSFNNLSPSSFLHSLNLSNPFNRKNRQSKGASPMPSPLAVPRSKSEALNNPKHDEAKIEGDQRPPAKYLNGTLLPTLKPRELIELANIGIVEVDAVEKGVGHDFKPFCLVNPTWCDSCGEFMWTPANYENCVNASMHFQSMQCSHCKFTCHVRCRQLVRIDCQGSFDNGTLLNPSDDDERPSSPLFIEKTILQEKIGKFNSRLKNKGSGLGMIICDNGTFRGFIRVHLNLTRPINVVAGTRPPSIYDIIKEDDETANLTRRTLTSFYMPRDTVKNIHITSESTSLEVIRSMLKKFKVVDNPQKFALYKCFPKGENCNEPTPSINGNVLKRIADNDNPLRIALDWLDSDEKKFVLQENDTADIAWDAFALPELQNFLIILEREEKEYVSQVKDRYMWLRNEMSQILSVKLIQSEGVIV